MELINCVNQEQVGGRLMKRNVFTSVGLVAVITATVVLTLSRVTPVASGIGHLKCYAGVIEKPCDRPPLIVRTSEARSD